MGNLYGEPEEVREYFRPLVELLKGWDRERRSYATCPSEASAKKLTTFCIELTAWLDQHAWLETLPIVLEFKRA